MALTNEDLIRFKAYCDFCVDPLSPKSIEYLAEILKVKLSLCGNYTYYSLKEALIKCRNGCESKEEVEIYDKALDALNNIVFDLDFLTWSDPI